MPAYSALATPRSARGGLGSTGQALITPRPTNPLLTRDDVGRARPTCYDLPHDAFAYGRPGNTDQEGAREVSMQWVSHKPSPGAEDHVPDFIHLHRKAASARISTAKDLKHFRREYDIADSPRLKSGAADASGGLVKPLVPSDVIPGFTYGRKVRPSTPIHEVISNRFGEKAEKEMQRAIDEVALMRMQAEKEVRRIPLTNASRGHAYSAKKTAMQVDEYKELFKLSKFTRVQPRIDSNIARPSRAGAGFTAGGSTDLHSSDDLGLGSAGRIPVDAPYGQEC